jgi:hypothetical protein
VSFQRCLRCGTDEYSGSYCTFCGTAEYELIEHRHVTTDGRAGKAFCPLGQVRNPGPAKLHGKAGIDAAAEVNRRWLANPVPPGADQYVIRHRTHPLNAAASPEKGSSRPVRRIRVSEAA